jgi:signal transduction histidine kinase/ligand-binding sensor domain-containing protein
MALLLPTICFLCSFALAQASRTDSLQLIQATWTSQQGAPEDVIAFAQTTDGFLWLSSMAGLFRFDGARFERFHAASGDQLLSTSTYALFAPPSGGLWIGYLFGGFSFVMNGRIKNYGGDIATSTGTIREFAEGGDGIIWAATGSGLWRFANSGWKHLGTDWNAPHGLIEHLGFDQAGVLWVMAGNALLYLLPGTEQFRIAPGDVSHVAGFAMDADGKILTRQLTEQAADSGSASFKRLHTYPILRKEGVQIVDRNNGVWISVANNLMHIQSTQDLDDTLKRPGSNNSKIFNFSPESSTSLVDREGNVWFSDSKTIYRFFYSPFIQQQLPSNAGPFAIAAGDDGTLWIAPWCTGPAVCNHLSLFRVVNGKETEFLPVAGHHSLIKGWVLAYRAPDKTFWFARSDGLWHLVDHRFVRVAVPPEVAGQEQFLQAISPDRAGGLWFSFGRHGLYRLADGLWTPFGGRNDLPKTGVVSEFTDLLGRVWFGYTKSVLAVLDGDRVQVFGPNEGVRVGNITAIYGRGTTIWIGGEFGLQRFDKGQFHSVAAMDDDWLPGIAGIVETADGDLWLNGLSGIFHISRRELSQSFKDPSYQVKGEHFDSREGLPGFATQTRPIPTAIEGSDGRLWFALTGGVVSLDPRHLPKNAQVPPITIQSVSTDNGNFPVVSPVVLPARTSSVRINYSAVSLSDPEAIRFRYKLQGEDADWHEARTSNPAIYRNLSPRTYHFNVSASDTNGEWSDKIASVDFVILAAWYQTTWFRMLCAVVLLSLLWTFYRLRLHQLHRQLSVRLVERVGERMRIARELHDTLLQSFQGLMLRLQLVEDLLPEGKARNQLEQTLERADQAIAEGRRAVYDLRSSTAAPTDLAQAVRSLGDEFATENSAVFHLVVEGAERELNPIIRDELYLFTREALRNAFSHARANNIEAEITYGERVLLLRIRDDGEGIPTQILEEGRVGHYGLSGMRERAKQVGGKLDFWSRAGAGTEIDLSIPGSVAYRASGARPWARPLFSLFSLFGRKAG